MDAGLSKRSMSKTDTLTDWKSVSGCCSTICQVVLPPGVQIEPEVAFVLFVPGEVVGCDVPAFLRAGKPRPRPTPNPMAATTTIAQNKIQYLFQNGFDSVLAKSPGLLGNWEGGSDMIEVILGLNEKIDVGGAVSRPHKRRTKRLTYPKDLNFGPSIYFNAHTMSLSTLSKHRAGAEMV